MKGITLHTGNSLERLAEILADMVRADPPDPMKPETVMVMSRGMERWISMRLSEHLGVWGNCIYPFPNTMIYGLFREIIEQESGEDTFDRAVMTWKLFGLIRECEDKPGFESLKIYTGDKYSPLKHYQLAGQIADVFDQYLTFRPDMMLSWDRGEEDHWQGRLWRRLSDEKNRDHRIIMRDRFLGELKNNSTLQGKLPRRLSLFGISTLPPFHLDVLNELTEYIPVHLFFLNPSRQYWGDLLSKREIARAEKKLAPKGISSGDMHLETGNSLLVSMGNLGRKFLDMLYDRNPLDSASPDSWIEPARDTLLHRIQGDILDAVDRGRTHNKEGEVMALFPEQDGDVEEVPPGDVSITIQSCHSPMREIEVLHDFLLRCFDSMPGLEPRDVLVMTPDIETFVPHIDAVFGSTEDPRTLIPYTIADRSAAGTHRVVRTFLAIASIGNSRLSGGEVLDIIECPEVLRRFNLTEADIPLLRKWTAETGIRWGMDENDRKNMGLPAVKEHTWRSGMERLLLGYAMPGGNERLFCGILPFDEVEGAQCTVLGGVLEFLETLFEVKEELAEPRSLVQWSGYLGMLVGRFFCSTGGSSEQTIQSLRNGVEMLKEYGELSEFSGEVHHHVIAAWLGDTFGEEKIAGSFLSGGVTFCAMLPMRSIPFKVICLVGMNNDIFPHPDNVASFNLMKDNPRPGDRSRRHDDRYIFLETLISARERLYLSYVGQSIKDNSEIPPSVVVSELLDYINQGYRMECDYPEKRIIVRHRLQPFSGGYFSGTGPLFSYSREHCSAAGALMAERLNPEPFFSGALPEGGTEGGDIDLRDFLRFFRNPAQYLLVTRLGMFFERRSGALEEREPFDVDGLDLFLLKDDIIRRILDNSIDESLYPLYRARGYLPHGTMGEYAFRKIRGDCEKFAETITGLTKGTPMTSLNVETAAGG
ncbi:MAG TPA: exodeoxyribonuclease V subunit gamma, partial [Spirochaetota bacterium]|nr:exodeoxyribonuclease V subunit gamma [Spirochaetota bacterium]